MLSKFHVSRGYSLLEVLAVLVIIAIAMAIAVPNYRAQMTHFNMQADQANIELIEGAVQQYRLDTGGVPCDLTYLLREPIGGIQGWDGPYLVRLPVSPDGTNYALDQTTGKVICQ
ncbi:MAG: type II secretion system protein GspG [Peptococcaceae bacterium]|nr:type II secretion system protein GspG [Peptococcaceae bacterium]